LILFHPGPAKLDCETCQKYVTDLDRGEVETYGVGEPDEHGKRQQLPQVRPQGTFPPCIRCPKQSPERAKEHELSEKNWRAFAHYQEAKAVGVTEEERRDPIVRRNFSVIDQVVKAFEAKSEATMHAAEIARIAVRK
jgi:hypothetical protein